jgi:hypothetical protein
LIPRIPRPHPDGVLFIFKHSLNLSRLEEERTRTDRAASFPLKIKLKVLIFIGREDYAGWRSHPAGQNILRRLHGEAHGVASGPSLQNQSPPGSSVDPNAN